MVWAHMFVVNYHFVLDFLLCCRLPFYILCYAHLSDILCSSDDINCPGAGIFLRDFLLYKETLPSFLHRYKVRISYSLFQLQMSVSQPLSMRIFIYLHFI